MKKENTNDIYSSLAMELSWTLSNRQVVNKLEEAKRLLAVYSDFLCGILRVEINSGDCGRALYKKSRAVQFKTNSEAIFWMLNMKRTRGYLIRELLDGNSEGMSEVHLIPEHDKRTFYGELC